MQMSRVVCRNCGAMASWPYNILTDDEEMFDRTLSEMRALKVECPRCGAAGKWMRKVASKL